MRTRLSVLATIGLASLSLWGASTASANEELETCGGVYLDGEAACEFRPKEECMTECMTTKVETACVAKIYTSCESSCTASASATCATTCTETCTNDCDVEAVPTCEELCEADCVSKGNSCDGDGRCNKCRSHNCSKKCDKRCEDEAPPEECEPTCATACMGSCTAQANVECQIDCQTEQYVECEEEMVETCETECEVTGGAIFCEGQFLATEDINECAEELEAEINISVEVRLDVEAEVDVDLNGGSAGDGGDKNGVNCSVADVGNGQREPSSWAGAMLMLGLASVLYRRSSKRSR